MRIELTETIYMTDIEYDYFRGTAAMLENVAKNCHNPDLQDDAEEIVRLLNRFTNKYTDIDEGQFDREEEEE